MSGQTDELPEGWIACLLGDVIDYGKTQKAEPSEISAKSWILELEDIEKDTSRLLSRVTFAKRKSKSTKNCFQTGDVLYGKLRPYLNKILIADQPGYCTTEIIPLRAHGTLENRYLFYWLKNPAFLDYVTAVSHGLNMPRLGTEAGKAAPFILAPLAEQKRITDKLEAVLGRVDACRTRLDCVPALLKRFRQSVLASAIAGELTKEWRELHPDIEPGSKLLEQILNAQREKWSGKGAYKEPDFHSATLLPAIPKSWTWAGIRQVGEVQLGRQRAPQHHSGDNMRPYLRVANVFEDRFDLKDVKSMNFTPYEFGRYCLKYGDILLNEGQTPELVGRPAMYRNEIPNCCYQKTLHRFRAFEGLLPQFALTVFRAYMHNGRFTAASSITTSIAHLTQQSFVKIEFPLPPLPEQQEIVRRVEALFAMADRIETRLATAQKTIERLTPATLAKAFRGELVSQDPNDEPSSALLDRLSQNQASAPTKPPRGKRIKPDTPA